jgi:hypothetical protein
VLGWLPAMMVTLISYVPFGVYNAGSGIRYASCFLLFLVFPWMLRSALAATAEQPAALRRPRDFHQYRSCGAPMKFVFYANTDWYLYNFRLSTALQLKEEGHEVVMLSPPGEFGDRFAGHGMRWVPPVDGSRQPQSRARSRRAARPHARAARRAPGPAAQLHP